MSRVRLVGVGPGHPGLATVQAVEAVKEADVIRNYDGCGTGLLHLAPSNADIAPLDSVDEVIRLARSGRKVTVLFPGNPYAFSNGSEVADRLERAGIDFEAVPGLIVELAAPVMSGIPLTIEGLSASIGFGLVTGGETVVLRLASGWWESGISALLQNGRQPEAAASRAPDPHHPGPPSGGPLPPRAGRSRGGGGRDTDPRDSPAADRRQGSKRDQESGSNGPGHLRLGQRRRHLLPDVDDLRSGCPDPPQLEALRDRPGDGGRPGGPWPAAGARDVRVHG